MRCASRSEIGYSQASLQENVPMAAGTRGGRTNSKHTVTRENILDPIAQGDLCQLRQHQNLRNMEYTNHQDMSKTFQFLQKEIGNVSKRRNILNAFRTNLLIIGNVHVFVDESLHPSCAELCWRIRRSTRTPNSRILRVCSTLLRIWPMEHSKEILNVKRLKYSSLSWARSVLAHDQAIKWTKATVCVFADSVPCAGQMMDSPGAIERWRGQV